MDESEALRAITLEAAKALGIDDQVGSLAVGKAADLVVFSGPPLSTSSRVLRVFVDGNAAFTAKQ
jgi:N-acetylglucosamine-6-phosphate deacetylase